MRTHIAVSAAVRWRPSDAAHEQVIALRSNLMPKERLLTQPVAVKQEEHTVARRSTRRPDHGQIPPIFPRLMAEFVGTFFLVLTVCMAMTPKTGAGPIAPLAVGLILAALVFAGGHTSGGYYNPAVSLAVFTRGKLTAVELLAYSAAQLSAGTVAGLVARWLVGPLQATASGATGKVFAVELFFTFALAYVVLNVATAKAAEGNSYFGVAIGFTVAAGASAVGGTSGAAFNPAVALGAGVTGAIAWHSYWIYVLASVVGGVLAAIVFLYVEQSERRPQ